jgi:uncharacterized protein with HEPN domain
MSERNWLLFAEDILESVGLIERYVQGMTIEQFRDDRKTVDAVVRNFEIIGEASKYIPDDAKRSHPDIDWTGILGLRNRIAHEYFGVSTAIVWQIVAGDLPVLRDRMQTLLAEERRRNGAAQDLPPEISQKGEN